MFLSQKLIIYISKLSFNPNNSIMSNSYSTVISFDIGKVNMSYCIVDIDNSKNDRPITIKDWCLTNLTNTDEKETIEIICSKCVSWLKDIFTTNKIKDRKNTWVLVERQRPINPDAFALSYTVFTYFMTKYYNINVSFVSAKSKLIEQTGRKRKRASVKTTKEIIENLDCNNDNNKWTEWFYEQSKKDDISDSLLQVIGNLKHIKVYQDEQDANKNTIVIDNSDSD
jgi:Poxvirus A22 protein